MDDTESSINGQSEYFESEMASEDEDFMDENQQSLYVGSDVKLGETNNKPKIKLPHTLLSHPLRGGQQGQLSKKEKRLYTI